MGVGGRFARIMLKPKPNALPCDGGKLALQLRVYKARISGLTRPKKLDYDDWTNYSGSTLRSLQGRHRQL